MTAVGLEESDHPEKMVECLGKIDTASRFLMGLLNDLVDVSMIELGDSGCIRSRMRSRILWKPSGT